jgi:DNA-binding GntR family transcriptional regulator
LATLPSPDDASTPVRGEPSVPRLKPRSLERDVYEILCSQIVGGRLVSGEPLVEGRLSAELGISKTPVREALIRLQRDGLVEIVPYRGARVASLSPHDVRDLCELRRWIEVPITRAVAERGPASLLERLSRNVEAAARALVDGKHDAYLSAVQGFSEMLVEHAQNAHAVEVLDRLRNKLALIANTSRTTPGRAGRSVEEHRAIFDAIASGDPDAAERATVAHILRIENDCLASYDETASPAEMLDP